MRVLRWMLMPINVGLGLIVVGCVCVIDCAMSLIVDRRLWLAALNRLLDKSGKA